MQPLLWPNIAPRFTALKAEVERLIFPDDASAEEFLRQYVEPQLAMHGSANSGIENEIGQLKREGAFKPCRSKISIEWLRRFRALNLSSLGTLFGIAAQFGDREELKEIIAERCAEFIFFWPDPTENENIEQNPRMPENLVALVDLNGEWIDRFHGRNGLLNYTLINEIRLV